MLETLSVVPIQHGGNVENQFSVGGAVIRHELSVGKSTAVAMKVGGPNLDKPT